MKKALLYLLILAPFTYGFSQSKTDEKKEECRIEDPEKGDCEEGAIRNETTTFPMESPAGDYHVKGYQVKLAFPLDKAYSRIWVKGSEKSNFVQIFTTDNLSLTKAIELSPPFYTQILSIPSTYEEVLVKFATAQKELYGSELVMKTFPKSLKTVYQNDDKFSMLFYGCFEPFQVNKETGLGEVLHDDDTLNYAIRQMFSEVAEERSFHYLSAKSQLQQSKLLTNPKLVIGGGDQIYTDAGYVEKESKNHPMSAWAHKCSDPYPLLDTLEYTKHLNRCYLHFGSFDCFDKIYSKLLSINTWDDHEIRDGWGSHGDEYQDDGSISENLRPYYFSSRQAFIDHQYSPGPQVVSDTALYSNQSLEQITKINGIDIFVFDLRSNRNNCKKQAMDPKQMETFQKWCQQTKEGSEVIIVSSIPFFYLSSGILTALATDIYEGQLRDDIIDSWASRANIEQRDTIINELIKLRKRNIKPIILSGDVHIGGLISVWYKNPQSDKNEKLCYEMISSGLSHESLGEARSGIMNSLKKRSRKIEKDESAFEVNEVPVYPVFNFTRGRLNFGALEFSKDENTIASLFITGDQSGEITEREMVLDWEESFRTFYKKGHKPILWYFIPWKWFDRKMPEVPYNTMKITELLNQPNPLKN